MWLKGAILEFEKDNGTKGGYTAVEDIWNKVDLKTEYISGHIVENQKNSDVFERVYQDTIKGGLYRTADQLKEAYEKSFK